MSAFYSPMSDPLQWQGVEKEIEIPAGLNLRYGGYKRLGVEADTVGAPTQPVILPAACQLRIVKSGGRHFVEAELNPLPMRGLCGHFPRGMPTFYYVFDSLPTAFESGSLGQPGSELHRVNKFSLIIVNQERIDVAPILIANEIRNALTDSGSDVASWQSFVDWLQNATNAADDAPVYIIDHTGRRVDSLGVDVVFGQPGAQTLFDVSLTSQDRGDLQAAIKRLRAADPGNFTLPNLWSAVSPAPPVRIRPKNPGGQSKFQLTRIEDGAVGEDEIEVTKQARHVAVTDLYAWFATQNATPDGTAGPSLERFHRKCRITPFLNGIEFFDNLFAELNAAARAPNAGFHHVGWAISPSHEFVTPPDGAPDDYAASLESAAQLLAANGQSRFLAVKFIQTEDLTNLTNEEMFAVCLVVCLALMVACFGWEAVASDGSGAVIIASLLLANPIVLKWLTDDEFDAFEDNAAGINTLGPIANTECLYSPYPATVNDNPVATTQEFPFTSIFPNIRHFGVYHQKFSVIRSGANYVGYCGGIDVNPNRLDDARHLAKSPYHDVHARIEGPAVRDLAVSFDERWTRDGGGIAPSFAPPAAANLGTPGKCIVQVGRTYFKAKAAGRRLSFAPNGDRTLLGTLLQAVAQAREFIFIEDQYLTPPKEYRDALITRVAAGDLKQVIVVIPGLTDQPFGEIIRSGFIKDLHAADTKGIVQVGLLRRRHTIADMPLRTSSGKLFLRSDLGASFGPDTATPPPPHDTDPETPLPPIENEPPADVIHLGPKSRVPKLPFWIAVGGELMWVWGEHSDPPATPDATTFSVDRGIGTRIGARPRSHKAGAAVTVVDLADIYVHAKLMIVDDVFLSVGSANLNRRGFYHDGEMNIFALQEDMRWGANNPISLLRRRLMAELCDLPEGIADSLVRDPGNAEAGLKRSYFLGNRFVPVDRAPWHRMLGYSSGTSVAMEVLKAPLFAVVGFQHAKIFDSVVDPTSDLDPDQEVTGG